MVWVSVGVLALWLLALTVVIAGVVRHLGTMTLVQAAGQAPVINMDLDADGPEIGTSVPQEVHDILRRHQDSQVTSERRLVVFFSPGCGTCVDAARELARRTELADRCTIFILGARIAAAGTVTELLDVLQPLADTVSVDEDARAAMQGLQINSVPFVVSIAADRIDGKLFIRRASQLQDFLDQFSRRLATDAAESRTQMRRTG